MVRRWPRSDGPGLERSAKAPAGAVAARSLWSRMAVGAGLVLGLGAAALLFLDMLLWPTLRTLVQVEVQNIAVAAMYDAVRQQVSDSGLDYRQFFHVETNADGQVTFLQPDTVAINGLAARIATSLQETLKAAGPRRIYIPLGRALGSRLLGGLGPRISVTVYPLAMQNIRIWDTFESAGINQTRHRIFLNIQLQVKTAVPFISSDVAVEGDFPLAEAVIVGQVPNTYVGGIWLPFFPRGEDTGTQGATSP